MLAATDYPFLDVFWTMLIFVAWVVWFLLLFRVFGDVFRRRDIGGGKKVLWLVFVILVPFLGVFVYLIANNHGMTERATAAVQAQQQQLNDHIQSVAGSGGAATEIEKAKRLLDTGAITQSEYDAIKKKALT